MPMKYEKRLAGYDWEPIEHKDIPKYVLSVFEKTPTFELMTDDGTIYRRYHDSERKYQ